MLWIKAFHVVFVVTWFAGLFYLPRLFVYHAMIGGDRAGSERFKVMERKLFLGIMTPSAVLTVVFGMWLWQGYGMAGGWLYAKFFLVMLTLFYHLLCWFFLDRFKNDANRHSDVFFRWFNEIPVLLLIGIVILAVVKPF